MSSSKPSMIVKQIPCLNEKFWVKPPPQKKGDKDVDSVFLAVGRALTQWEMLEQRLAALFCIVCNVPPASNDPVRRACGAIENGTLRRSALLAAAEVHFGSHWTRKIVRTSFVRLIESTAAASKRRDDIAHGIVRHHKYRQLGGKTEDHGAFLFPPYYNTGRTKASFVIEPGEEILPPDFHLSDFRYTSADILEFEKRFGQLKRVVSDHYSTLCAKDHNGRIPFVEAVTGESDAR